MCTVPLFSSGRVVHAVRDTGYNSLKLDSLCEECGCIIGEGGKFNYIGSQTCPRRGKICGLHITGRLCHAFA